MNFETKLNFQIQITILNLNQSFKSKLKFENQIKFHACIESVF